MLVAHAVFPFRKAYNLVPNNHAWGVWILGIYLRKGFRNIFDVGAANGPKDGGGACCFLRFGCLLSKHSILESFKETSLGLFFLLYCDLILEL